MKEKESGGSNWAEVLARALNLKPHHVQMVRLVAMVVVVGLLLMTFSPYLGMGGSSRPPASATEVSVPPGAPQDELVRMEREMELELASKLSLVQGAGRVEVSVTLESGPTVIAMTDTKVDTTKVAEDASDGSKRVTDTTNTVTTHVVTRAGGVDSPGVMRKERAQIAGVLIVAEGARSASVRELLHSAAVTALHVSANRVTVIPRTGG